MHFKAWALSKSRSSWAAVIPQAFLLFKVTHASHKRHWLLSGVHVRIIYIFIFVFIMC
jgi:hypothetical protein